MVEKNKILEQNPVWDKFGSEYYKNLKELLLNPPKGWNVQRSDICRDNNHHPTSFENYECIFAAKMIQRVKPESILDIGSYRQFIIGLLAGNYKVSVLDVRLILDDLMQNELRIDGDAKFIPRADNSFDCVLTLCSIEHFGLGRYGDDFDIDADIKAIKEIKRVLKPKGYLIFTTPIINGTPSIWFNAHRIYNYEEIIKFSKGFNIKEEQVFNMEERTFSSIKDMDTRAEYDIYCGCWQKK